MNTTCLVLASAVAGEDVVSEVCRGQEGGQMEWTGDSQKVPGFRLQLGRKVLSAAPAQPALNRDEDEDENKDEDAKKEQEVQLAAVSLCTSGAKSVVPLV